MRLFVVGVLLFVATSAVAQSRWTVSAGPEWSRGSLARTWGVRLRAEYDLTRPSSLFGLRLESGARWGPTQGYFYSTPMSSSGGTEQRIDLMLGVSTSFSPMPRARVSPYATFGVFGRQQWIHGSYMYQSESGSFRSPLQTTSRGDIVASLGLGLRARLGGRAFQLEYRWLHSQAGLTFGTRLPF